MFVTNGSQLRNKLISKPESITFRFCLKHWEENKLCKWLLTQSVGQNSQYTAFSVLLSLMNISRNQKSRQLTFSVGCRRIYAVIVFRGFQNVKNTTVFNNLVVWIFKKTGLLKYKFLINFSYTAFFIYLEHNNYSSSYL